MSESLWSDIDQELKSSLYAYMGSDGAFTSLVLESVEAIPMINAQTWAQKDAPFALIASQLETPLGAEHQDLFTPNVTTRYRYAVVCVASGELEQVTVDAKILDARARRFILQQIISLPGLEDDLGDKVTDVLIAQSNVTVYPITGVANQYFGISMRAFDVLAHMKGV